MNTARVLGWLPETCPVCGKQITLTMGGLLRIHGHPARRCMGSGKDPERLAELLAEESRRSNGGQT